MKKQNQYYWEKKEQRAEKARRHTDEMERKYGNEISSAIKNTKTYRGYLTLNEMEKKDTGISIEVLDTDTVSAVLEKSIDDVKTAVLNFASYRNPGGMFIRGSKAQEECLCHESFLYNVLKEFKNSYYDKNESSYDRGLYSNAALYSPDIIFERDWNMAKCDVITCASPNYSAAKDKVTEKENEEAMRERIRFVLEIAKKENVDILILGAWGCGVFGQNPTTVANLFIEEIERVYKDYKIHIVFAVIPPLPNQTDNCTPFKNAVHMWEQKKLHSI